MVARNAKQVSDMTRLRVGIVVVGIILPYVARVPRGFARVEQYTEGPFAGHILMGAFNAVAWGALLAASFLFRRPGPMLLPCALGFGFLAVMHYSLDLAADAQAAIALLFIPVYAVVPIAVGVAVGLPSERRSRRGVSV
ncbi:MAG: hypothetical protein AAF297_11625 [Planctomycetota bacterium]